MSAATQADRHLMAVIGDEVSVPSIFSAMHYS
ncbi:hypothetical protein BC938DRAFT_478157 [Jimgerdemannia flammicorona]|uniref:Uncharacterized protein n=1 Tax=Jimgerdemannia flammicorona TaxID=994334 RepID=A0A433QNA4_9FUNG|nr:hypothetical protein BC938DRAFT_478157 [Jimgerdemannia flammicorona]